MKDKKVSLGADGKPVDHNASTPVNIGPSAVGDWDDWSIQGFDDENESTVMDEYEDSESTTYQYGDDEETQ